MTHKPTIRLYVPGLYAAGQSLVLGEAQSHYVAQVMRAQMGEEIAVFNGEDGQWHAELLMVQKKHVTLQLIAQTKPQRMGADLWLVFAPIKNKTDIVVEKATEMGVSQIHLVYTRHGVVKNINRPKLEAHIIEAAEQCERLDIPPLHEHKDLRAMLAAWPQDRTLFYGDESGGGLVLQELLPTLAAGKISLLVGPEGGFSTDEHQLLKAQSFVTPISLGPRILRADTAAVAALACLQSWMGDWK